jgi:hypothetical protein
MRKILISAVAAILLLGACGDEGPDPADDPKGALTGALEALNDYEGVTMTLRLDSDTGSLVALSEGSLTDEQAQQIIDSSLTITSKQAEDPADAQAEITANIAGNETAFEMKVVDAVLYARADVAGIMETFGQDPSQLDQFEQQAAGQPGFEFVEQALNGEWIALKGFEEAMEQFGGQSAQPTEAQQQALETFTNALKESVKVEAGDAEGPGDHVIATVPLKEVYDSVVELQSQLGTTGTTPLPPASDLPDEELRVDAWIDGGRVTQFGLDFKQFAEWEGAEEIPEGADRLSLLLELEEFTGDVEAPEGATEVDLNQIMQSILGTTGGLDTGAGGTDTADLCAQIEAQLEGQPQEVVDQMVDLYGAQCPGLGE